MANIIPMAGLGLRFSKEGYALPKPMIPVSGMPMIVQVIRSLPGSNKWIFIVRQEHIQINKIDEIIKSEIPEAIIIAVNKTTPGQANTCLLAQAYLEPEEPVLIAACDNAPVYDKEKYNPLVQDPNIDCIVWTFTRMKKMPYSLGWAKLAEDQRTIAGMSVKVPLSDDPYHDHAVVATFYFKKAGDFFAALTLMIKENHRINDEFYVDAVPLFMKKLNKKSVIFDVDQHICFGTPAELKEYEEWEKFFKENRRFNEKNQNSERYLFWKKYFQKRRQDPENCKFNPSQTIQNA